MMNKEMKLPATYAAIESDDMTYLEGGAAVANPQNAWDVIVNVSTAVTFFARMLLSVASVVTNINTAGKMKDSFIDMLNPDYYTIH